MSVEGSRLGMKRGITRQDFVNGVASAAAGSLLVPRYASGREAVDRIVPYRPSLTIRPAEPD